MAVTSETTLQLEEDRQVAVQLSAPGSGGGGSAATGIDVVQLDASGGNVTKTLPSPEQGAALVVSRIDDSTNTATVETADTASQEIRFPQGKDASSVELRPEQSLLLTADGTNWYVEEGQGLRAEAEDVTSDGATKESPRLTQTATYDSDTSSGVTSSDVSIERYVRTDTDGNAVLVYEHDGTEIARLTDAGRLETRKDQEAFMDGSLNSGQGTNSLLQIEDGQGDVLTTDAASLQFTGSGISLTKSGDEITVDVSGGSGSDIDIEQNQTPVVGGATGLSFEGSGINSVSNDGDGTATVNISKGSSTEVQEGGTAQVSDVTVLDFVSGDFSVANPSGGEAEVSLQDDTVTVAGNSVPLGGSTGIAHGDLSSIGSDDHHTKTTSAADLTDVSADSVSNAHHTRYSDSEARTAVEGTSDVADLAGGLGTNGQVPKSDGTAVSWTTLSASDISGVSPDSTSNAHHSRPLAGGGLVDIANKFSIVAGSGVAIGDRTVIDDFEAYSPGNTPSGWTGATEDFTADDSDPINGEISGKLEVSSAFNGVDSPSYGPVTDDVRVRLRIDKDTGNSSDKIKITLNDDSGSKLGRVVFQDGTNDIIWRNNDLNSPYVLSSNFWSPGTVYEVRLSFSFEQDAVDIYVDGAKQGQTQGLQNSASNHNQITFANDTNTSGDARAVYIDDIIYGGGVGVDETVARTDVDEVFSGGVTIQGTAAASTLRLGDYTVTQDNSDGDLNFFHSGSKVLELTDGGILRAAGDVVAFGLSGGGTAGSTSGLQADAPLTLNTTTDPDTISLSVGTGLTVNNGTLEATGTSNVQALADLSDVGTTGGGDGEVLVGDGTDYDSTPLSTAAGNHIALSDLSSTAYSSLTGTPSIAYNSTIPADDFTSLEVSALRQDELASGATPWTANNFFDASDARSAVSASDVGLGNVPNTNIAYSSTIPADAFTSTEVSNLRSGQLDDGTTPWASNNFFDAGDARSAVEGTSDVADLVGGLGTSGQVPQTDGSTVSWVSLSASDLSDVSPDSTSNAHHSKTTTASELVDVSPDSDSSAHHTKYSDSEARLAVEGTSDVADLVGLAGTSGQVAQTDGTNVSWVTLAAADISDVSPDSTSNAHHSKTTTASELVDVSADSNADAHHAVFEPADYTPVTDVEAHGDALAIDITGDADTLGGVEASNYARTDQDDTINGTYNFPDAPDPTFTSATVQFPEGSGITEGDGSGSFGNDHLVLQGRNGVQAWGYNGTSWVEMTKLSYAGSYIGADGSNTGFGGETAPSYAVETSGDMRATGEVEAFLGSDRRLKTALDPLESALDKVDALTGYGFNWHDEDAVQPHKRGQQDVGLIAQEVEDVLPEAVKEFQDGHSEGYKSVSYDKVVPLLVEAIKDLRSQVQELQ